MSNHLYDGYLNVFLFREIGKHLNMSFDDFINRPKYEIEAILRIIDSYSKKKASTENNILNDLKNSVPKTNKELPE